MTAKTADRSIKSAQKSAIPRPKVSRNNASLVGNLTESLRSAISTGELSPGDRLPTELALGERFGVSRPTVRAALNRLKALGLVATKHGVGTFVVKQPAVRTGLERLDSITESIRATGKQPGMHYATRTIRPVLPEEAAQMGVGGDTQVLELRRSITANGEVIAFSYDLLPMELFPTDFDLNCLEGSLFHFLATTLHKVAVRAEAELHAVHSSHVGWGAEAGAHDLFVLLNQLHYDSRGALLLYSRTYFIEARYTFTLNRRTEIRP